MKNQKKEMEDPVEQKEDLKPIPISNQSDLDSESSEVNAILAALIALIPGFIAGSRSRSNTEGFIYVAMFVVESLICFTISMVVNNAVVKRSSKRVSLFIAVSAFATIIALFFPERVKSFF